MRSIVGVGMTPPKVLGTPKPASSVMISSTFGAPFGGTTRGAHQAFDCSASSLMTPPNLGSGGGSCLLLIVVVALGEPRVPVTCCPSAQPLVARDVATTATNASKRKPDCMSASLEQKTAEKTRSGRWRRGPGR
jgi:hypothetical protein